MSVGKVARAALRVAVGGRRGRRRSIGGGLDGWSVQASGLAETMAALEALQAFDFSGTAVVGADAEHAVFVEMGTWKMDPDRSLRDAIDSTMSDLGTVADRVESGDELLNEIAYEIAERYRGDVPIDTGELRDSIYVEPV